MIDLSTKQLADSLLDALRRPTIPRMSDIEQLNRPFVLRPDDYIRFAEKDLESDVTHRYINALSNTKRALDCQIECILYTIGIRNRRWDSPKELSVLQSIGLMSPIILNKINRMRNLLEHEFETPIPAKVTDALDTVILFVAYTNAKMENFRKDFTVEIDTDDEMTGREITFTLDQEKGKLFVSDDDENEFLELDTENVYFYAFMERLISISDEWI